MLYQRAEFKDGKVIVKESKTIDQNKLTSDCWLIQFEGLKACQRCEFKNTSECGGGETLKRILDIKD